jgi:muconate cycloisomerase
MHVVELTAFLVRIPLKKKIRHASHSRDATENVLVRCTLDDGTEGFGEGVPRDYVTGETSESAITLLRGSDLAAQLTSYRDFPEAVAAIERLQLTPVPGDDRACQGNAARCALELALLDAFGRRCREPLSAVTRLLAPDLFEPRPRVRYSGIITSTRSGFKTRWAALALWCYRFTNVKVKVGVAGQDDELRLRHVRSRLGWSMDLRLDVNEAWQPDEVVPRIRALEPYRISAVEQPVPHADVDCLTEVRKQVSVPIMHDESLCSLVDAQRAWERGTCDLFNLRLSKCGGYLATLRLAQFARQHGLGCQLGCQVGETAILSAAGRHFASSVGGLRWAEGSYDSHLVREALGTTNLTFGWGGWAPALVEPGLGVNIDPAALKRVSLRKEPLLG